MIDSIHIVKLTSLGSTQSARQYDLTGRLSRDEVKQVVVTSNGQMSIFVLSQNRKPFWHKSNSKSKQFSFHNLFKQYYAISNMYYRS